MSGQVSGLVLRMTGPAGGSGSLRTPPSAPRRSRPSKSWQILVSRCRSPHIRAITGASKAKRARLGAKPGFSSVDAKWARGQRRGRVAAGLLPFSVTAC